MPKPFRNSIENGRMWYGGPSPALLLPCYVVSRNIHAKAIYGATGAPKVMFGLCVGDVRFVFGPPKPHAGATHKSGISGAQIRHAILMPIGTILATYD
jgi:hypothetical protein